MKINKAELEKVAVEEKQYPDTNIKEFAFAGRSNVGKSSFINAMLNRKNLARTSSTPGKTRTINFYRVNDDLRLVDLPGYGYAKVAKSEKEKWAGIINRYLENRENLVETILLVDIRHEPTALDKQMYDYIIESGFSGIVIATKKDKIKKSQVDKHISIIAKKLGVKHRENIIPFSSSKRDEVKDMWFIFEDMLRFHEE
ncbi:MULTISPECIES: ribosome biogenesis GTP-binding protein YihA/YsxC [Peptoniphilus]|jgi:ribosome biogenesis GTP-binding protein ysxC|uniref:Probable GTP-binding protein EngB n=1 Tax=Peptoniphilus harei TaxID=54005 RepID=A0A943SS13_9FIRM|nr:MULTISPECIES: ribosome biogenesis GTP-binding protein YihA/YsxC [Peptoniphilus]MBS6535807.1 ribosome biogenesis GTP-binding protein YihA/YsxC [Peptoniphilus harei]MDU1642252.1 ribosome biogenesis GTP-binding protein YihA/YsxC [Peptoniphilus harei]MDU2374046.1 ribosome biogenesis GTP-binding protein YihA/YsxC [Peptoniphilus harei]MDU3087047.1 ribosome biogenesis GTP-binding protein YihA/YsxC [Peptoniphilus harei]MDU6743395.1 ribosome biogenesis GTP-binding protein YihA/YsxC [Peptoniphilus ha